MRKAKFAGNQILSDEDLETPYDDRIWRFWVGSQIWLQGPVQKVVMGNPAVDTTK